MDRSLDEAGGGGKVRARKIAVRTMFVATVLVLLFGAVRLGAQRYSLTLLDTRAPLLTRTGTTGAEMVTITEGPVLIGCDKSRDSKCDPDELPGGSVYVRSFAIDRYEATTHEYAACVTAGACTPNAQTALCNPPRGVNAQHPINCIDARQAEAYCRFRDKRLPTSIEWEKAARGDVRAAVYPWGDEEPTCGRANLGGCVGQTVPVHEARGSAREGIAGFAGNVWEWTSSEVNGKRVIRGGSFYDLPDVLRTSNLGWADPSARYAHVGVRCARDLPSSLED